MPNCLDCDKPLSRKGVTRCRSCQVKRQHATTGFRTLLNSETARAAVAAREAKRAETERLARLAREAGLG